MNAPQIFNEPNAMHDFCVSKKRSGQSVGFVPTMGALHEGHLSLVRAAIKDCDIVIVSIYVNPTQFSASEDLGKYPRPIETDLKLLAELEVAAVFLPSNETMYPSGFSTFVNPPLVSKSLEGNSRPEHFQGVATIVLKLFNIILANRAYFGQKDYQQALVIRRMVEDLNIHILICVCPIVRDQDGLALSSRNVYLTEPGRKRALAISKSLRTAKLQIEAGETDPRSIENAISEMLQAANAETCAEKSLVLL